MKKKNKQKSGKTSKAQQSRPEYDHAEEPDKLSDSQEEQQEDRPVPMQLLVLFFVSLALLGMVSVVF